MRKNGKMLSSIAAGGVCRFTKEIMFTKTFSECEEVDFHHSGIIPKRFLEKVKNNEILYFNVVDGKVHVFQFRWEEGLYTLDRYKDIENEVAKRLGLK